LHFNSEGFSIPRVNGPDLTGEGQTVGTWVSMEWHIKPSPEGVSLSAFTVTTPVFHTLAGLFSGSTVVLPMGHWIGFTFIVIGFLDRVTIIEDVFEVHVTVTNGFITSTLVQSVGHSDVDITHGNIISRRQADLEVAILPSTD
jgi:hypothetical protein